MPLVLLRLVVGKNFPLGQQIHFTAFWCGDEGRAGPVMATGSDGRVKIYEEIAFIVKDDDERLRKSTVVCLTYGSDENPLNNKLMPHFVARMTVDLKAGIIQKFCVFPAQGDTGVSPFVEVHFGLESLLIQGTPKTVVQSHAAKIHIRNNKRLVESKVPDLSTCLSHHEEKIEQHCENLVSTTDSRGCHNEKEPETLNYEDEEMEIETINLSDESDEDLNLYYDPSESGNSEKTFEKTELHPALAGLLDSGWGDGSEDEEPDFLDLKFQKSFHTLVREASSNLWERTKGEIDDQINSLD